MTLPRTEDWVMRDSAATKCESKTDFNMTTSQGERDSVSHERDWDPGARGQGKTSLSCSKNGGLITVKRAKETAGHRGVNQISMTRMLPTNDEFAKTFKGNASEGFCQKVSPLERCVNLLNGDFAIGDMVAKAMPFE
jgi:hypothetical protein